MVNVYSGQYHKQGRGRSKCCIKQIWAAVGVTAMNQAQTAKLTAEGLLDNMLSKRVTRLLADMLVNTTTKIFFFAIL